MKIELLVSAKVGNNVVLAGNVIEVSDAVGRRMIKAGTGSAVDHSIEASHEDDDLPGGVVSLEEVEAEAEVEELDDENGDLLGELGFTEPEDLIETKPKGKSKK